MHPAPKGSALRARVERLEAAHRAGVPLVLIAPDTRAPTDEQRRQEQAARAAGREVLVVTLAAAGRCDGER